MKRLTLSLVFSVIMVTAMAQTTHLITNQGLAYTPDSIMVAVGDTVKFDVGSFHPTLEVDQSTWQNNGTSPKSGGFDFPSGNASFVVSSAQTFYYVCTNHVVSDGMKGKIVAQTLSEDDLELEDEAVYPNPVENKLTVDFQNPQAIESLSIIDMQGKKIKDLETGDMRNIDVSSLKKGNYILLIEQADNTSRRLRFSKR